MKEYITEMAIACLVTALITGRATGYIFDANNKQNLQRCNAKTVECLTAKDKMCHGQTFDGVRMTTMLCHGEQELCFCGSPSLLKGAPQ